VADYLGVPWRPSTSPSKDTRPRKALLTQVVETAPGQPLSMSQVRSSIAHLFSLGRFEDVRVDATLDNGASCCATTSSPIHPVGRIRFAIPPRRPASPLTPCGGRSSIATVRRRRSRGWRT
jgi:hypothetical protein